MALGGRGIKKVNYSQLFAKAKGHRTTAELQVEKFKGLSKQGQDSKEAGLLHLHQEVWQNEWEWLMSEGVRVEREIEEWRANILSPAMEDSVTFSQRCGGWMEELMQYMADLYQQRRKFEQDTLGVLKLFQVELKNWVDVPSSSWGELWETLESVKQQQRHVQDDLQDEYFSLWHELQDFNSVHCGEDRGAKMQGKGVPMSVQTVECSNGSLKSSLMEEFERLSEHYLMILQQLKQRHAEALR